MRRDFDSVTWEHVLFDGEPALFAGSRVDMDTVPETLHFYEVRHADDDWAEPIEVGRSIFVNFYGTLLTHEPLEIPIEGLYIGDVNHTLEFFKEEL